EPEAVVVAEEDAAHSRTGRFELSPQRRDGLVHAVPERTRVAFGPDRSREAVAWEGAAEFQGEVGQQGARLLGLELGDDPVGWPGLQTAKHSDPPREDVFTHSRGTPGKRFFETKGCANQTAAPVNRFPTGYF